MSNYITLNGHNGKSIKAWTNGVPFDDGAKLQLLNVTQLPFVYDWIAAMPDVHVGKGATIGSVIPTTSAIIPAAVGVDIGCGMMAVKTSLNANDLDGKFAIIRSKIEKYIPHGRSDNGGKRDIGSWENPPKDISSTWEILKPGYDQIISKHPVIEDSKSLKHLGTLGTGNHFIEICIDEDNMIWIMLHSGSRGVGNKIGTYFIELAKEDMRKWMINLPDKDLAYLKEGTEYFDDYILAVEWAQHFAMKNREIMMNRVIQALKDVLERPFNVNLESVNCHHNYVTKELHYGSHMWITRKGAVRAGVGEFGIIPGSMGAKSFIVEGLGNEESFASCSHGAGRLHSRTEAKKIFNIEDHRKDTEGVECRKDKNVIDETPKAYKSIDDVMSAQQDLVKIKHTLKQIICVKG